MDQRLVDEDLAHVLEPVATAHGLPNRHYTDPEWFETEKDRVFFDNWAAIGFAKDVPGNGDAMPVGFLGQPLVIVRGRDGKVRVFQNICRHRGMILVRQPGHIRGAIRCPYHSWSYDLDGTLKATPHVGGPGHNTHEAIDRGTLGLIEVRSHIWRDVVFVNISGDAESFETVHADVLERWKEFDHPLVHSGPDSSFELNVKTNWKLAVENYCESYHLPWVHPGLNSYSRLEDHYHIEEPGAFSGQGTRVYRQLQGEAGEVFADAPDLSKKWDTAAEYISLYPNVLLGVHRDHSFAIILEPVSTSETVEHVEIYYHDDSAVTPEFASLRARNTAQWKTVFEEDIFVVEGMQQGRNAVHFDGGRFSPVMDSPTHMFHHWVATQLSR
jgi:phenylpropionate dioxygenase-like ring-hydroxylating dioxygenase large terminal subunit